MGCCSGSSNINEKLYSQAALAVRVVFIQRHISKRKGILAVALHISLLADAKTVAKDVENLWGTETVYLGRSS